MKVENCPECGGTHFGSYTCPMPTNRDEAMKKITFEDAIADLKNVTAWNMSEHFPTLLAGLNDAASRLRALEQSVKDQQGDLK